MPGEIRRMPGNAREWEKNARSEIMSIYKPKISLYKTKFDGNHGFIRKCYSIYICIFLVKTRCL